MLKAIRLPRAEIEGIEKLAAALRQTELPFSAEYRGREAGRFRVILDMLDIAKVREYNTFYMKNVTKILAKEVRRIRALVEVAEKNGVTYLTRELEILRQMLAMLIKMGMR
jgi:hypothetical protein